MANLLFRLFSWLTPDIFGLGVFSSCTYLPTIASVYAREHVYTLHHMTVECHATQALRDSAEFSAQFSILLRSCLFDYFFPTFFVPYVHRNLLRFTLSSVLLYVHTVLGYDLATEMNSRLSWWLRTSYVHSLLHLYIRIYLYTYR